MKSSGIKRGLAAIAVSAVAVAGIPALAMADSIDTQVTPAVGPTDVQLYNDNTSFSGPIDLTAKNDGTDTTVRLEAGAGINVPAVIFQVSRNGGAFADIATVAARNDDGAFSYEWNPAANGAFPGDTIDLRVVNAADITEDDTECGFTLRLASAVNTQAINITAGEQKGYFEDPDALTNYSLGVVGTTSVTSTATIDRPCMSWQDGGANDVGRRLRHVKRGRRHLGGCARVQRRHLHPRRPDAASRGGRPDGGPGTDGHRPGAG